MDSPGQQEWEAAALRLFEDEYAFIATGPRAHLDWRADVIAVMNREAEDPRDWISLDWDKEGVTSEPDRSSAFPFTVSTAAALGGSLHQVTVRSAAQLLVALTDEWFTVKNIPNFSERKDRLLDDAQSLISRYGPDCDCYTTAADARTTDDPDFFHAVNGGAGITEHLMDLGLVVVSETEVGVFWRFNTY
ncbi:hypothetical protein OG211_30785 [Streptomyces niveus]|uniref:hypothetical protein n=1 Tax=Streptomyces niveus TaxID=193462 RepID=UPI00386C7B38|nr:hypothetical protein OG211_30785 [Streptomyces niveus]